MSQQKHTTITMLIAAVLISTSAVWVKVADMAPTVSAFYRMFIAGATLFLLCYFQKLKLWVDWRYLFKLFLVGFFFAIDLFFWHRSILYVGPGLATVLGNFQVFFMTLFGFIWLKESIGWLFFLGLGLTFSGLFLLVGINWSELSPQYHLGVLYGILTAVAYTAFMLMMRHVQASNNNLDARANLGIASLLCAAILLLQVQFEGNALTIPDLQSAGALLILGLLCQVIGWLMITRSMPLLPTSIVGVLLLLQPALSMLWDVLFFDRSMTSNDLIGLALVLIGIYLAMYKRKKAAPEKAST
ncbi:DMT family transporter [Marinicella sp. W31]|uniref:DMT family transporter n=1 Tax=Marinicella sp. W31 TaxID=3023713 RepID=UPI003757931F